MFRWLPLLSPSFLWAVLMELSERDSQCCLAVPAFHITGLNFSLSFKQKSCYYFNANLPFFWHNSIVSTKIESIIEIFDSNLKGRSNEDFCFYHFIDNGNVFNWLHCLCFISSNCRTSYISYASNHCHCWNIILFCWFIELTCSEIVLISKNSPQALTRLWILKGSFYLQNPYNLW